VGAAKLSGPTDHAGIDVYIPGTGYIAKTDEAGNFTISGVPVGEHNLYFEMDGYHRGQFEALTVSASASAAAPEVTLVISIGTDGFILIEGGTPIFDSLLVSLTVGATMADLRT